MACSELVFGVLGFMIIEDYSFVDAFYMVVITISTVGFMEVEPLSEAGRLFTAVLISVNIGVFAYALAVFSYYIVQGEIFKLMHVNQIQSRISDLKDHVIVCGYGKYGTEIVANLLLHQTDFVIIENDEEKISAIRHSEKDLLYLEGDATRDEVLLEAGIEKANGLICSLGDDSDNLFIVLSARQLNPTLNIISRAVKERSQPKLIKAGADHVVMPENIGGFYMATLISKPSAVEFFSFITREYESDIGFEELHYEDLLDEYKGVPIRDMHLRSKTGANIIGYRNQEGAYQVNPGPDTILREGGSFIVLGSREQLDKLHRLVEKE